MLIDTHCHLFNEDYDIDKVIFDAYENGVCYFILGSSDMKDNFGNISLCEKYPNIYTTLGFHPSEASKLIDSDISLLEEYLGCNKVVGIGEIGLDYHYGKGDREAQIKLFRRQLEIASRYSLPVVIHTRDAIMETYEILKEYHVKGIIHCFSGSLEMAHKFIDLGFLLGIGGVITFSNSKLSSVVKEIDLEHIVLETDSPYLSPFRGQKNEPKNVKKIANFIAELKGVSLEKVEKITTSNAAGLFDLFV